MKKYIILLVVLIFCITVVASSEEDRVYLLAEIIAGEMGDEPFVVRVIYGEMLLNSPMMGGKRKNPSQSDLRAAAAAYCQYGFSGGARNAVRWKKAESTPLEMRSGVRLYGWYFYI